MSDKPLHVRVAEALGWTYIWLDEDVWCGTDPAGNACSILCYDTDWAATGPLIEKYEIQIDKRGAGWCASAFDEANFAHLADPAFAETPLIAVCNLILALKEEGNLTH